MSPPRVDARHFSPDTREFIEQLHRHGVRYLIVGGEAVIFYGHARLTGDVDFFYDNDQVNRRRLYDALSSFWDGEVPGIGSSEDLGPDGTIVQFGVPPNRIDLVNLIDGVTFAEAWSGRQEAVVFEGTQEIPIHYIGIDELIRNKTNSGRPKDLDDLAYLREMKKR